MDAADEWAKHGDVVEWWKGFENNNQSEKNYKCNR